MRLPNEQQQQEEEENQLARFLSQKKPQTLLLDILEEDREINSNVLQTVQVKKLSSPERVLFISVFLQTLLDATKPETAEEGRASKKYRRSALKWFTVPACVTASTYEPICELSGINPDYGRKFFSRIINKDIEFVHRRINVMLNNIRN